MSQIMDITYKQLICTTIKNNMQMHRNLNKRSEVEFVHFS